MKRASWLFLILSLPRLAAAHIGSPSVFFEGEAGPYPVRVVIRPPGAVFLSLFLPVHWFFSAFLLSPEADNWFFVGTRFHPFFYPLGEWTREYWGTDNDPVDYGTAVRDLILSLISARVGLSAGDWLARVKR